MKLFFLSMKETQLRGEKKHDELRVDFLHGAVRKGFHRKVGVISDIILLLGNSSPLTGLLLIDGSQGWQVWLHLLDSD